MFSGALGAIALGTALLSTSAKADFYNPNTDFLNEGSYGLYFSYLNAVGRDQTDIDEFNRWVDGFGVLGFVSDVQRSGAAWVVWPLGRTWFNAPNNRLERSVGNFTSDRDLPMVIAEALAERDIGFILMLRCDKASNREDLVASKPERR